MPFALQSAVGLSQNLLHVASVTLPTPPVGLMSCFLIHIFFLKEYRGSSMCLFLVPTMCVQVSTTPLRCPALHHGGAGERLRNNISTGRQVKSLRNGKKHGFSLCIPKRKHHATTGFAGFFLLPMVCWGTPCYDSHMLKKQFCWMVCEIIPAETVS